ncbi:uncharacterized protein DS421_14g464800 [Arachis hypogaea]|nr:uncharacterized protein DS421_14g464800 [Arachis hypogaea]
MSSRAKQSLKTSILKQQSGDSEVIQKIDQLLNRFTTVPEAPTNSDIPQGQSNYDQLSNQVERLTKPSAYGYNRVSTPDLALEERELGFVNFNSNNVYEWNIDDKTEFNIISMLQHMTMVGTSYQAAHETSEEAIANVIVSGFSGQLKG